MFILDCRWVFFVSILSILSVPGEDYQGHVVRTKFEIYFFIELMFYPLVLEQ
jgi:hypothetical protein